MKLPLQPPKTFIQFDRFTKVKKKWRLGSDKNTQESSIQFKSIITEKISFQTLYNRFRSLLHMKMIVINAWNTTQHISTHILYIFGKGVGATIYNLIETQWCRLHGCRQNMPNGRIVSLKRWDYNINTKHFAKNLSFKSSI